MKLGAAVEYGGDIYTVADKHHISGRLGDSDGPSTTDDVIYIYRSGDGFWISESEVTLKMKTVPAGTVARRLGGIDSWIFVGGDWRNTRTGNAVLLELNDDLSDYVNNMVFLLPSGELKKGSEL